MALVADNQAAEVVEPCIQSLDLPAPSIAPKRSPILCLSSVGPVRSNHLDAPRVLQIVVEEVAVKSLVANQALRPFQGGTSDEGAVDQSNLMRRSTCNADGDRESSAIDDGHDLGALASFGWANEVPPFLALAKVASMKHSLKSRFRRSSRDWASAWKILSNVPSRTQRWNHLWQVWYGGYLSGMSFQRAPDTKTQRTPSSTVLGSFQGRPRLSLRLGRAGRFGAMTRHCSSVSLMDGMVPSKTGSCLHWNPITTDSCPVYETGSTVENEEGDDIGSVADIISDSSGRARALVIELE